MPLGPTHASVVFKGTHQNVLNSLPAAVAAMLLSFEARTDFADGTGAVQAKQIYGDKRILAASASESLDFNAGGLVDVYGAAITWTEMKVLIVMADPGNANDVIIGDAASNPITTIFGATGTAAVKPGGCVAFIAPAGYGITAATADLLKVANSSSGTGVTYTIIALGN